MNVLTNLIVVTISQYVYMCVKSLHCIPLVYKMIYVNYISLMVGEKNQAGLLHTCIDTVKEYFRMKRNTLTFLKY